MDIELPVWKLSLGIFYMPPLSSIKVNVVLVNNSFYFVFYQLQTAVIPVPKISFANLRMFGQTFLKCHFDQVIGMSANAFVVPYYRSK